MDLYGLLETLGILALLAGFIGGPICILTFHLEVRGQRKIQDRIADRQKQTGDSIKENREARQAESEARRQRKISVISTVVLIVLGLLVVLVILPTL